MIHTKPNIIPSMKIKSPVNSPGSMHVVGIACTEQWISITDKCAIIVRLDWTRKKNIEGKLSILLCYSWAWGTCSSPIEKKTTHKRQRTRTNQTDGRMEGMLRQWTKTIPIITINRNNNIIQENLLLVAAIRMVSIIDERYLSSTLNIVCTCFEARVILVDRFPRKAHPHLHMCVCWC